MKLALLDQSEPAVRVRTVAGEVHIGRPKLDQIPIALN